MSRGFIVSEEGSDRRRVPVGSSLVIGRAPHCGLVIKDTAASRQHLEIRVANGGFVCQDLDSKNGTKVNGVQTVACELRDGDVIHIGGTELTFEIGDAAAAAVPEKTVFLQTVLDPAGRVQAPPPPSRSKELLEAAYTVMNAIASNFNPCDLVDSILRTTMDAIRGQRGAVLFAGPDGEMVPCTVCKHVHTIRDGVPRPADLGEIRISESVARRVLDDGENVLYQFARSDAEVDSSVSIRALNLTSILCVPIRTKNSIQGILYVDTDIADHRYTQDDLLLAAAVGNSAGLALENARIHRALLEKQRIEQEIAAAWTIQEGFLVRDWPDDDPRFEVYGETRPAKTVGGDFYDYVRLDGDTVGVLIGDVSGKGVPAALTMAQLLAEFRLCALRSASPAEVVGRLSERLAARSQRGTFCSLLFATIDLASGMIVGANAGHHPMLVVGPDRLATVLEASGPPAGILPGARWQDATVTLAPGETLLMLTDGIFEARSGATQAPDAGHGLEYGLEGLRRVLQRLEGAGPRGIIEEVMADVQTFCAPLSPHDDCTMIGLRYRGRRA